MCISHAEIFGDWSAFRLQASEVLSPFQFAPYFISFSFVRDWFSDCDASYIYEFHKANVQLIQHNRPNPGENSPFSSMFLTNLILLLEKVRWVFKAPMHSHHVAEIQKVYPGTLLFLTFRLISPWIFSIDAIFVLTQREPTKIVSSVASLRSTLQQLVYDPYDVTGSNKDYALNFISKSTL
jgi:hypothetical protein